MPATHLIDAHCHIYPTKVAAKAVESIARFYNLKMRTSRGTAEDLLEHMETGGIERALVHSVAIKPATVTAINDFIAEQQQLHPEFVCFATMHQDFEDMEAEVERCISLGLKGFKLHPDSQGVTADDPRLMRLYELIEGRLPLILHCGDYRWDFSHPWRIRDILHTFPHLVLNAAHFGGWSLYDLAIEYLENESCFMDISSSSVYLGPRRVRELIDIYGAERIMFGSDFPMWDPAEEVERFEALELGSKEQELLAWRNAERFVGEELF
jgi:predicted TIM-barrel fold metal-dependent hydrolase